jgi:hypothetical protein
MNQALLSSYDRYLEAFNSLDPLDRRYIRRIAASILAAEGAPEIGSSDISCKVFELFKEYGRFDEETLSKIDEKYETH